MADLIGKSGLIEQIRLVTWLRWRILRNSVSNKNRRLDLIGLIFSGFFSVLFVGNIIPAGFPLGLFQPAAERNT